ncbi:hypothetical protein PVAND_015961 [Polypedilum vanderplanki]|uniref:Uncharacterized protein n=1 Tax=Polypedilum vanderplanki TaxID=319348 RepID=A0A9J6BDS2_POLVA|nr:hypothetical protein PVAND_015961 [Polypedilum vanderplanki]
MKFFVLLIFVAFIALIESYQPTSTNVECKFINGNHDYFYEKFYSCQVLNFSKIKAESIQIDSVTGIHKPKYSNRDVTVFSIHCTKCEISTFPKGIHKFFTNIKSIKIDNTKLKKLTKNDLEYFPDLNQLWLPRNEITRISQDTFKFNPKLKVIILYGNQIYHIDPKTFTSLKFLVKLDLADNDCETLGSASDKEDVDALINQIDDNECVSPDYSDEK